MLYYLIFHGVYTVYAMSDTFYNLKLIYVSIKSCFIGVIHLNSSPEILTSKTSEMIML